MRSPAVILAALLAGLVPLAAGEAYTVHPLGETTAPYGYLEHLPADYQAKARARHPLVFFLHGLGELGDSTAHDLPRVAGHGPLKLIAAHDPLAAVFEQQSAIVIAPQGLKSDGWWRTEKLVATLWAITARHAIDPDRIYITGLSMGGGGTWALATAMPERIAAIAPVCGAAKPGDVAKLRGLPIWAHHAIGDPTVRFSEHTQAWFDAILADLGQAPAGGVMAGYQHGDQPWTGALLRAGWQWRPGTVPPEGKDPPALRLTVYPDASHDCWTRAYENPLLWSWLFAQSRAQRAKAALR